MQAPAFLRGARAATVFLTRIPVGGHPFAPAEWRWWSAWSPVVGCGVGVLMAGGYRVGAWAGPMAGAVLAVGVGLLATGAFHEDGLADTADALGGGFDRERVLAILKDSRIGAFGAAALVVVLLWRVALLAKLDGAAPLALVLTQGMARIAPVWLMVVLPPAQLDPKSGHAVNAGMLQAIVATGWGGVMLGLALHGSRLDLVDVALIVVGLVVCAGVCGWRFHRRVGGRTGDFLGATEQLAECGLLFILASR